jgi:hypothetical protein
LSVYEEELSEVINCTDKTIWDLKFSNSGRSVSGNEGYALASEWAGLMNRDKILVHPAADEFRLLIPEAPCVSDYSLVCYRGRSITGKQPCAHQMGPPEKTNGGRYNPPGQSVLYLSDSEEGVLREFQAWKQEGTPYIQRYTLPFDKLRIADFTKIPSDHFVCAVFSFAEECEVEGRSLKSYLFSQTIAELIADYFDGMRVPGVRGEPGIWYSNIVIFRPFPGWLYWIDPNVAPYRPSLLTM